ncbi:MAG: bacillithiol biosynthesis cysteine-adding enzyme BshC [Sphingobacteriales bacterium]|nr:MAG: bacillithiol biosynthesis cysteine-adding enzyme BshC [Sphingobacteriales bacterium]TAF82103.1 MAG: bacillithiol biosynthesis cysteine-adding enzyme BshC [Sphingobacteriales bacterium]
MEPQYINYKQTDCFSPTIIRYLAEDESLKPFVNEFANITSFEKIIKQKNTTCDRDLLVSVLKNQYQIIDNLSPKLITNLHCLQSTNTFTITTGHQINIFTGPLYVIFKIVTAIKLSQDLKLQFPNYNFVPLYWMATEDHDFEEINHAHIGGKKIIWDIKTTGATGRISTKTIKKALDQYTQILGSGLNADALTDLINTTYTRFDNLANATRYLVNQLFGNYGLVILDADNAKLKTQFVPIIKQDMLQQNSFKYINASDKKLTAIGIKPQVAAREINFFYLKNDLRERIVFENNSYQVVSTDIKFTQQQLLTEIDNYPDRFSPNAVLRPLYQEVILPNIAYIGGGAELTYWLQLKATFDFYGVDFPIVMLRNSAMIIPQKVQHKLQKLQLKTIDVFTETLALKNNFTQAHTTHNLSLAEEWRSLSCIFESLKLRSHKIDASLSPSTEAVKTRLHKAIKNLEKKLLKAEKRNFTEAIADIDKIKNLLFPQMQLQERSENFGLFYVQYGNDFIAQLIKNFVPLDFKFTILQ